MLVTIDFFNSEVKRRFIEWVAQGNERSVNSFGGSGIRGSYKALEDNRFLFFWETNSPVGDYYLLRLALWFNFRKRRKELKIKRIDKESLARLIIDGES